MITKKIGSMQQMTSVLMVKTAFEAFLLLSVMRRKDILYHLIRMKTFDEARFQKRWLIIVDATWLQTYREEQDEFCLCREYKQEDGSKNISGIEWHWKQK